MHIYSADKVPHGLRRGAPVLQWAGKENREDKALVTFLVWANPANLAHACRSLQDDGDVVMAALHSPFYHEDEPKVPCTLLLRELRAVYSKEGGPYPADYENPLCKDLQIVLDAVSRSGYELEHAGEGLRADPYVVAWAGAPVGADQFMHWPKDFVRLLKSDYSVAYFDENWCSLAREENHRLISFGYGIPKIKLWLTLPADIKTLTAQQIQEQCTSGHYSFFYRVAPSVCDVLWPTTFPSWDNCPRGC